MSYVRWSTPISLPDGVDRLDYYLSRDEKYWNVPTSDFYIYAHCGGFYSVNVAGNRHRPKAPFTGSKSASAEWIAWLDANREPIDHPAAGQTFEFRTMAEAVEKVEALIADGFLAPDWLLDELRKEDQPHA